VVRSAGAGWCHGYVTCAVTTMVSFIAFAEAEADEDTLRDELIDGSRKAIGLANGAGLPVSIPSEHFTIAWEQPTPTAMKPIGGRKPGRLIVHDGSPPWETLPENFLYREPWLDVTEGVIYAADGSIQWARIRVEGGEIERIPLPKLVVKDRPGSTQPAASYALGTLYARRGYPAKASMQQITNAVNAELRKPRTPLRFRIKVGRDTVQRLLRRRR